MRAVGQAQPSRAGEHQAATEAGRGRQHRQQRRDDAAEAWPEHARAWAEIQKAAVDQERIRGEDQQRQVQDRKRDSGPAQEPQPVGEDEADSDHAQDQLHGRRLVGGCADRRAQADQVGRPTGQGDLGRDDPGAPLDGLMGCSIGHCR